MHVESSEQTAPISDLRVGGSVSLAEAAKLFGISRRTIYNRIREGRLRTVRTRGGSQRVVLDARTVAAARWGLRARNNS